ncbi:LOW QUALITY PROTEIN: dedicator of cytokinesis protein 4 [Lethenteron reissneri]|uniref:LOW QUALITY PROTEIN: dedicator of cytokinesis protein 4 n=1 Tax=Lethenteron reissneri TaxID=7753 RepID=UPI002AB606E0|nr:LOW QUALITY PROTEIN: dedicator of cytokinesis protein 4 [Lethenteron reissneri]
MWSPTEREKLGVVICSFSGGVPHGLALDIGEGVQLLERFDGWYRGFNVKNPDAKGIFPASHIHVKEATVGNRGKYETVAAVEDPTVAEVTSTLREWGLLWKQLYLRNHGDLFHRLRHVIQELLDLRRQLLSGVLTQEQIRDVKRHSTARLDWGNEQLGLDLVPRQEEFRMVDPDEISVTELFRLHAPNRCRVRNCVGRSESRLRRPEGPRPPASHHLQLALRNFTCNVFGDEAEVLFSLYDSREARTISERFLVRIERNGMPKCCERLDRQCVLFTDLGSSELRQDLYVVAHVIRVGRMLTDSKRAATGAPYRRPHGCAVLSVAELLASNEADSCRRAEREFMLKVYTCSNENDWHQIHENIIRKSSSKYNTVSSNYGLLVSLQLFHGDMEVVRRENPLALGRGVSIARKLGAAEVIMPGDMRNELYVTLERGEFERGGKTVQKNVEVTMVVVDGEGEVVTDCVSPGCGDGHVPEFRSLVLYHNNVPRWGETLRLPLAVNRFRGAHIRFEFRHCSTKDKAERKLFGFAFTPLMNEDGSTLADATHELYVYKCEEYTDLSAYANYLGLHSSKDYQKSVPSPSVLQNGPFQRSQRETFWISTLLCSSKLTQNSVLLGLLNWKAHSNHVVDILPQLKGVHSGEIVKFLQDILDALFSILDDSPEKYSRLVFQSLVQIINLVRESRFEHFRPVMDTYIEKHFCGALAYKELLRCLQWYMDRSVGAEKQDHIQEMLRSLEYIFKFVVQSRWLFVQATGGQDEGDFRQSVNSFFRSVQFSLSQESKGSDTVTYTQAAFLSSFPALFGELLRMLSVREVATLVRDTLGCLPPVMRIAPTLRATQLQCVTLTTQSQLFHTPEPRWILLPVVLRTMQMHLQHQLELPLCATVLGTIFSLVKRDKDKGAPVSEELDMLVGSLLHSLVLVLLELTSRAHHPNAGTGIAVTTTTGGAIPISPHVHAFGFAYGSLRRPLSQQLPQDITGEYVSCLLSLLRQMSDTHYQQLLDSFSSREHLRDFMLQIFAVFNYLLREDIYPRDWMLMRMVTNNVVITAMQYLSSALHSHFAGEEFDIQVWSSYFNLAVMFINQPSLQLEAFTMAKRQKIMDRYDDMRVMMGYELFSMWQNLGENKQHFIPGLIGPFLGITLVPQAELRGVMIPIFHDMMDWEQRVRGNFKQVEAELIDKLDSLVAEGKGDENYRELFSLLNLLFGPFPSLLEKMEQEAWRESGVSFVTSVTRLMERLLDYRDCMTDNEAEDKKIGCTVSLLNFYKNEINKEEMYVRYIHKLFELHRKANNFTEAAFTLNLYSELLRWDEQLLCSLLHYPVQTSWQRKEQLLLDMIHLFECGKSWENGIQLCEELADRYKVRYEYRKLSKIRKTEAVFYDHIMEQPRLEPEFFRIGFYGRKFPFFLRNKEFVCRGHDYERLETFQQRMLGEFPHAAILTTAGTPDAGLQQADTQYLQMSAVSPVPEDSAPLSADAVHEGIRFFYRTNWVQRFRYDRPFQRGPRDRDNEFKSLWIERTTLKLTHCLPGISRWFEVESREVVELSPLENAVQALEQKARELRALIAQYKGCADGRATGGGAGGGGGVPSVQPLSMCLNGVIDAAVNGGIARYQEAFFMKDYLESHLDDWQKVLRLKELMMEQVHILYTGLEVHERVASPDMQPLHKRLVEQFCKMRASLAEQETVWMGRGATGVNVPISTDMLKFLSRQSPLSTEGSARLSGSSLSSQASVEAAGLPWTSDGAPSEGPDEAFPVPMQASSPSTSSLSSTRSAPACIYCPAPSSVRGSPSLSDKIRESFTFGPTPSVLPLPRDRPFSALVLPSSKQRPQSLQQVAGAMKPCSDPNLSTGEKAMPPAPSSWSLDEKSTTPQPARAFARTDAELGPGSPPVPPRQPATTPDSLPIGESPPALPLRSSKKSPLRTIPASPTDPRSLNGGSHGRARAAAFSQPGAQTPPLPGHVARVPSPRGPPLPRPASQYAPRHRPCGRDEAARGRAASAGDGGSAGLAGGTYVAHDSEDDDDYEVLNDRDGGYDDDDGDRPPKLPVRVSLSEPNRITGAEGTVHPRQSPSHGGFRSVSLPGNGVTPPALPPKPASGRAGTNARRASESAAKPHGERQPSPLPRKMSQNNIGQVSDLL